MNVRILIFLLSLTLEVSAVFKKVTYAHRKDAPELELFAFGEHHRTKNDPDWVLEEEQKEIETILEDLAQYNRKQNPPLHFLVEANRFEDDFSGTSWLKKVKKWKKIFLFRLRKKLSKKQSQFFHCIENIDKRSVIAIGHTFFSVEKPFYDRENSAEDTKKNLCDVTFKDLFAEMEGYLKTNKVNCQRLLQEKYEHSKAQSMLLEALLGIIKFKTFLKEYKIDDSYSLQNLASNLSDTTDDKKSLKKRILDHIRGIANQLYAVSLFTTIVELHKQQKRIIILIGATHIKDTIPLLEEAGYCTRVGDYTHSNYYDLIPLELSIAFSLPSAPTPQPCPCKK